MVDIMMSVIVLMVAMYILKPVEFSVFPTTLLSVDAVPSGSRMSARRA